MKKLFSLTLTLLAMGAFAQGALDYQVPPQQIKELVDAPLAPSVRIDGKGEKVVLLYRNAYKTIAELSEEELRLGGLRINPVTNIGSRTTYYNGIEVKGAYDKESTKVSGLPDAPRFANFRWSPNEKYMSFTHTTADGVEAWILDIANASAEKGVERYAKC